MTTTTPPSHVVVVVVGAGPVGCATALLLSRRYGEEITVELLERRANPLDAARNSTSAKTQLKSINLALSDRGRATLRELGLESSVLENSIAMYGRRLHLANGTKSFQHYDEVHWKRCIYSVSRGKLNDLLLEECIKAKNVKVRFNVDIVSITERASSISATERKLALRMMKPKEEELLCDFILGCDGAHSVVRELSGRAPSHYQDLHRTYIQHGYCELHVPPQGREYALDRPEALHIWPRTEFMMIALPNPDRSFTATFFAKMPFLLELSRDRDRFLDFLEITFPDLFPLLAHEENHIGAPYPLFTNTVSPWSYFSHRVCLLGDAAHTQVPFFGQGMNAGLEDALSLVEIAGRTQAGFTVEGFEEAIRMYDRERKPQGEAITVLSAENYAEMSTHTASLAFRLAKRVEGWFARVLPQLFLPLYYQVAFTRTPYALVLERKRRRATAWAEAERGVKGVLYACGFVAGAVAGTILVDVALSLRGGRAVFWVSGKNGELVDV